MCDECESEVPSHASYAEKRKLMYARWQPKRPARDFTAEPVTARPRRAGDLGLPDGPRSTLRASPQS